MQHFVLFFKLFVYNISATILGGQIMANINIRIDDDLKKEAETLFEELGLSTTGVLIMFLKACVREQGIPFKICLKHENESESSKEN